MSARWRWTAAATAVATASAGQTAASEVPAPIEMPVGFGADEVQLDARTQGLDAAGHVRVDEPPFHLRSDGLRLRRVPIGVLLEGSGEVTFCPCLGAPLAVRFSGATLAPPHDLILRNPVLEVFGVPVAWAPAFWLRSPGRVGLLPPDVAWRGGDGLFAGAGVHVPWVAGDEARGLDLRGGGYFNGGVSVETGLRTTATDTHVRWDRLRGSDGVTVGSSGATALANVDRIDSVAWSIDALRGKRAVVATTDLDAAARPFDRAAAQAVWRPEGWVLASEVRTVALRGSDLQDLGVGGPVIAARRADALGSAGTYDATFEGGQVAGGGFGATSFARAEGGMLFATRLGALGTSFALRGLGSAADDGARHGVDGQAQARAAASLPFLGEFASADPEDPWVHRTAPGIEAALLTARSDQVLVTPAGRGSSDLLANGQAWLVAAEWTNSMGRRGSRNAMEAEAAAGAIGNGGGVRPLLRGTASVGGPWVGLRADFARVLALRSVDPAASPGGALVARATLGPESWLHLTVRAAERDGVDPLIARALVDAPFDAASGFLSAQGWTGGARLGVPLGSRVTTRGGADVDLDRRDLVAAVASLELHDPCECVVLRATAAHRIGRDGVDVWVTIDLPTISR